MGVLLAFLFKKSRGIVIAAIIMSCSRWFWKMSRRIPVSS